MVYAFLGALAWASLDVLRKRLTHTLDVVALSAWLNGGAFPVFVVWIAISGGDAPLAGYLLPGLGSLTFGLVAQLLFLLALRWAGLAATIPMLALTPALSSLIAWLSLGELPTGREGAGLALIVVGCLANGGLVAREGVAERSGGAPHPIRGTLTMAGVAALWSAHGVIDKVALQFVAPATHAAIVAFGTMTVLLLGLTARGTLARMVPARDDRGWLAAAMVTLAFAYGLQLLAVSSIAVGVVEGIKRGLGVPAAMVSGWAWFGESVSRERLGAGVVVAAGLWLVA